MPVISLSLTHLGLGLLMIQALVGLREVGRGFFTLCGWSGAGLAALGWLLSGSSAGPAASESLGFLLAAASILSFAVSWLFLRRRRRDIAAPFHSAAGFIAAAAVFFQGWFLTAAPPALASVSQGHSDAGAGAALRALAGADFLLSAGLLGGVTVAMVLGHWYLVQPGLSIVPLKRLAWTFIIALLARTVMESAEAASAIASGAIGLTPPPGEVFAFPALVLAQRALFGLAGPLILAPLVYKTVTMRSTMSATGLLYVAVALVWVGEFLSKYLLMPLKVV